jgi:hypothetical protein
MQSHIAKQSGHRYPIVRLPACRPHLNFSMFGHRWPISGKRRSTLLRRPPAMRHWRTTAARARRCAAARNSRVSRQLQMSSGVSTRYFTRLPRAAACILGLLAPNVCPVGKHTLQSSSCVQPATPSPQLFPKSCWMSANSSLTDHAGANTLRQHA